MKKIIVAVLISALFFTSIGFYVGTTFAKREIDDLIYENPEDLVIDFFDAMKKGDTKKAITMFGIQKKSKDYDLEGFIERIQAMSITIFREMPSSTKMFAPLSELSMKSRALSQLSVFILSLNTSDKTEELFDGNTIALEDNEKVLDEILEVFELEDLQDLHLKEVYHYKLDSDNIEESYEKQAKIYNCETKIDVLAIFEYDKDDYVLTMTLLKCEEGYFIESLNSSLLGTPIFGIPEPLDFWEDRLDEEDGLGEYIQIWEE